MTFMHKRKANKIQNQMRKSKVPLPNCVISKRKCKKNLRKTRERMNKSLVQMLFTDKRFNLSISTVNAL